MKQEDIAAQRAMFRIFQILSEGGCGIQKFCDSIPYLIEEFPSYRKQLGHVEKRQKDVSIDVAFKEVVPPFSIAFSFPFFDTSLSGAFIELEYELITSKIIKKESDELLYLMALSLFMDAGMPFMDSLEQLQFMFDSPQSRASINMRKDIEKGSTLSDALKKHACFTPLALAYASIGEFSGTLDRSLREYVNIRIELIKNKKALALPFPGVSN
jgi:hypothetical protein